MSPSGFSPAAAASRSSPGFAPAARPRTRPGEFFRAAGRHHLLISVVSQSALVWLAPVLVRMAGETGGMHVAMMLGMTAGTAVLLSTAMLLNHGARVRAEPEPE